ncbi:scavenger receptor cysteine-rich type 1 protein M130-like [Archocentrus centrarchus]|uniref:scavenger receptor cysteine-rich type 1 protein M130-like n=1 Tax=Archocentrus centrarchus TaxID=63155 RepID=UPI0011E9F666|nr:scavenger receptor cysteine-rich type 1 protein M130-like [Archocentrus centrarchus]
MDHLLTLTVLLWSSGAQCETVKADLVMLVDESWSISNKDFKSIQLFLKSVVNNLNIGPDRVQIGLTLYSDTPRTMWHLNTYQTKQPLLKAIADLTQFGGGTRTGKALRHILHHQFKPNVGMRPDSKKTAVLITDGESQDEVLLPSKNLKDTGIEIYCIDSVRLLNGSSLCSGRLEEKSNQNWSSVCEADFGQQDAEVVCRELDCGPPSVLQGVLYGEVEAPMWTKEFQCRGNESAILDCRSSGSVRKSCSPDKVVGLTCSEPVRLVGGANRCAGTLEVRRGEWRPVAMDIWNLKDAAAACGQMNCGSAVSVENTKKSTQTVWWIESHCVQSGYALKECASAEDQSSSILDITCSDSVRLLNGSSLCSGRLEVKSNQYWSSVCEADFGQQDAEVVCRELDCGPPSVLQGVLYGEVEAPMWTKEFQCRGNESALLDCRSSGSARKSCSTGKVVVLTCSEPVRLVGGASRCAGTLEVKQGLWRSVEASGWTLMEAAVACRELGCGSAVLTGSTNASLDGPTWKITPDCVKSGSTLRECATSSSQPSTILELICSEPTHQGNYSCVYHVFVFSHNFSSESRQLSLIVSADPTVFLIRLVLLLLSLLLFISAICFTHKVTRRQQPSLQVDLEPND